MFNGLENFVTENFGLLQWQKLLDENPSASDGVYLASEFYDDNELIALVRSLCEQQNLELADAVRDFGYYLFDVLHASIPEPPPEMTLFEFLRSVDKVIHVNVKRTDPQAYTPAIYYDQPDENTLLLRYVSRRKLCFFAEGLVLGAADKFDTKINVSQTCCQHRGDKDCIIKVELCQKNKNNK